TLFGIVETVGQALKLPYVGITLGDQDSSAMEFGEPVDDLLQLPLTFQGQRVGTMHVARRAADEKFTPEDLRLLENISQQTGAVAHSARLTADLQRARQRLVTALEEERRRIRRDLHDGLGPQLASLSLKLDAAQNLLESKPTKAGELLMESKHQVQDAVEDIRRLVYNLRPPALDELGLMSALRERAATFGEGGSPRIIIEGPDRMTELPAAVEVAAYRIIQEAINNASRHAGAENCWVRIRAGDALTIEIEDDGSGLPPSMKTGVGISSMRERTSELGGRFEIENRAGGGTHVRAWLPLEPGESG
ncbi:MAG: histidine kinase, partial [Anaerolineales bacterium]